MVNGSCTAFIKRFSNQRPVKTLYGTIRLTFTRSRTQFYTPTTAEESAPQGDGRLVTGSQGGGGVSLRGHLLHTQEEEEPGIEPGTLRLPAALLHLLGHMPPMSRDSLMT